MSTSRSYVRRWIAFVRMSCQENERLTVTCTGAQWNFSGLVESLLRECSGRPGRCVWGTGEVTRRAHCRCSGTSSRERAALAESEQGASAPI